MLQTGSAIKRIETQVWATPKEGASMDDLISSVLAAGNKILHADRGNRRVLISYTIDEAE